MLAKKSMAILKETNRIDMDDDIEDAEFIIANYEKNVGGIRRNYEQEKKE